MSSLVWGAVSDGILKYMDGKEKRDKDAKQEKRVQQTHEAQMDTYSRQAEADAYAKSQRGVSEKWNANRNEKAQLELEAAQRERTAALADQHFNELYSHEAVNDNYEFDSDKTAEYYNGKLQSDPEYGKLLLQMTGREGATNPKIAVDPKTKQLYVQFTNKDGRPAVATVNKSTDPNDPVAYTDPASLVLNLSNIEASPQYLEHVKKRQQYRKDMAKNADVQKALQETIKEVGEGKNKTYSIFGQSFREKPSDAQIDLLRRTRISEVLAKAGDTKGALEQYDNRVADVNLAKSLEAIRIAKAEDQRKAEMHTPELSQKYNLVDKAAADAQQAQAEADYASKNQMKMGTYGSGSSKTAQEKRAASLKDAEAMARNFINIGKGGFETLPLDQQTAKKTQLRNMMRYAEAHIDSPQFSVEAMYAAAELNPGTKRKHPQTGAEYEWDGSKWVKVKGG